jgi:hypothetical protein
MSTAPLIFSDCLKKGNILHFDKFDFFDGVEKKGRFLIILQVTDTDVVIATTTASFALPSEYAKPKCIKPESKPYRGYYFQEKIVVGAEKNYFFDKNSYVNLYINPSVFYRKLDYVKSEYFDSGNIEFLDRLNDSEYIDFIYCVYHSPYIKRGLKKYLDEELAKKLNS